MKLFHDVLFFDSLENDNETGKQLKKLQLCVLASDDISSTGEMFVVVGTLPKAVRLCHRCH